MIVLDIDPNVVKPGWTPLIIILLLAAVMVLLYRSMRRQFSKIEVPPSGATTGSGPSGDTRIDQEFSDKSMPEHVDHDEPSVRLTEENSSGR